MHNERVVAWAPLRRVNRGGRGRVKRIGRQPVDGFRRDDDELSRAQQRGGGVQRGLLGFELGGEAFLHAVGGLPQQRTLRGLKLGKVSHDMGDTPFASEEFHPERFHFLQRRSLIQALFEFRDQAFEFRKKVHL